MGSISASKTTAPIQTILLPMAITMWSWRMYRRRYGELPICDFDSGKIADIQGEQFDLFLGEAVKLIRARGKKTQIHLNVEYLRPDPQPSRYIAYPWNIRFDWVGWLDKGWADEATLRTYQVTIEFVREEDSFSQEVIAACRDRGGTITLQLLY